jgi:hypothetical protein
MGRKITNGITTSNVTVPATLNIVNTTISTSETNANLVLAPDGTGIVSLGSKNLTTTGTVTVGTITNNGGSDIASFNTISAAGLATFNEISEITQSLANATGTITHDFSGGGIFYHTTPAANWTANFTNVPTTDNRAIAMVLVINQGGTGRYPSAVQIAGVGQTIRWANNTIPTPGVNRIDICSFTLLRVSSTWFVMGNYTSYA